MAVQYAFGQITTQGLDLVVDAANPVSYPRTGTVWTDTISRITGSLTGSVSYTSEFYGGLTFSNSSSAVIFPSSVANYNTNTFVIEMAFKPTFINGRHYLMSKNSGSFPNWAIYLSGSAGSGKLWSEFRISSTVSCSVSSSTTFVTGSVYQVDVRIAPSVSSSAIYINGQRSGGNLGNGGGSLTTTASLFVGNFSQNNTQSFSGSIYTIKVYNQFNSTQPRINLNTVYTRFNINPVLTNAAPINVEYLIVAGGGSGGTNGVLRYETAGGGAGGLLTGSISLLDDAIVIVGDGGLGTLISGSNGNNSVFGSVTATGGGSGGSAVGGVFVVGSGGSGGGAIYTGPTGSGIPGQGNNGSSGGAAGGGGGAGTSGLSANGGSGSFIASFSNIGGLPAGWFAGGGGGFGGNGGIGGGASGSSNTTKYTGSANTGGGGGGFNAGSSTPAAGGKGGSGIVAIRYIGPNLLGAGGEVTTSGSYIYHTFKSVGTSSFVVF
jgi:hypothetical protein